MIEKRKASKRKVAKRGGNVTKAKVKAAPKVISKTRKVVMEVPKSKLNKKGRTEMNTRNIYGTTPSNVKYVDKNAGAPPARTTSTKGLPKSTAKKVPTKIATGVKRSMTASDARGLKRAMKTGKMSNVNKEVNSMKSRRVNKATTRYKK